MLNPAYCKVGSVLKETHIDYLTKVKTWNWIVVVKTSKRLVSVVGISATGNNNALIEYSSLKDWSCAELVTYSAVLATKWVRSHLVGYEMHKVLSSDEIAKHPCPKVKKYLHGL